MADTLPEGTDHSLPGASGTTPSGKPEGGAGPSASDAADLKARAQAKAEEWRQQAAGHARDYAEQGKDRASGALDNVARLIDDNAAQIDDRIGSGYGDYARRAASFVTDAADGLRDKDIDELLDDARDFVRRSPGIAVAAAAAAGFAVARVVAAGSANATVAPSSADVSRTTGRSRKTAGR